MTLVWIIFCDQGPYTNPDMITVYATEEAARAAAEASGDPNQFVACENVKDS